MISVSGLRLIDENGKFLQSVVSVDAEVGDEVLFDVDVGDEAAGDAFFGAGATVSLLLVVGTVVVAKKAFFTTSGSDTTWATGGGLSGGCGCIGVIV
jgi:hypothetical protein